MNEQIMNAINPYWVDAIMDGRCPVCETHVDGQEFRDELSRKEFKVSGLCQKCQSILLEETA
jgi:hypothetical protein